MFGLFGKSKRESSEPGDSLRAVDSRLEIHFSAQDFHDAFERGDYELALRSVESLKHRGKETPDYCYFLGFVLMQLGRFADGANWLRKNVEQEKAANLLARGYSALGQCLMQDKQYDEAIHAFISGLKLCPNRGSLNRDLAEATLRRGDDPSSALDLARKAVDAESRLAGMQEESVFLGESLATLAWILAAADGDEIEVDQCVKRAIPMVREQRVSSLAQVHYHSGLAYATLGDRGRSMRHFEEAVLVDPKGLWGRGARVMAHGMSKAG